MASVAVGTRKSPQGMQNNLVNAEKVGPVSTSLLEEPLGHDIAQVTVPISSLFNNVIVSQPISGNALLVT